MDIKGIEDFVDKKGAYKLFNKAVLKGYIALSASEIISQELTILNLKDYAQNVINRVNKFVKTDIDVEYLFDIVNFEFFSDYEATKLHIDNQEQIKSIKVTVKEGKENSLEQVSLSGSATVKTFLKLDLNNLINITTLNNLKFGAIHPGEGKIISHLLKANNIEEYNKGLIVKNIDKSNKSAIISLSDRFNNPYFLSSDIELNYT
ncbi:hypothetical protein [Spiroplasma tabanidicola]|uniref:Uncharacterized protein n=1 Tax=Spiroplasma tabanidicola TaxID=324079 RepID=A0A6I6C8B5_9MOLU|nr:hypothetical protein [Spiroplasma tabanidicola]QGS51679.1 hypothetical protein STABA_v1c03160 [Spiroplasma tabanidicola]